MVSVSYGPTTVAAVGLIAVSADSRALATVSLIAIGAVGRTPAAVGLIAICAVGRAIAPIGLVPIGAVGSAIAAIRLISIFGACHRLSVHCCASDKRQRCCACIGNSHGLSPRVAYSAKLYHTRTNEETSVSDWILLDKRKCVISLMKTEFQINCHHRR